jgi:hypothetical protein
MAASTINLNLGSQTYAAEFIYVDEYGPGVSKPGTTTGLAYLHRVRQLGPDYPGSELAKHHYYSRVERVASEMLASYMNGRKFDAVLSPPSRRADAEPYRKAILAAVGAPDWTPAFSRASGASAGETPSCDEIFRALTFSPPSGIGAVRSVLMVDDVLASGTTACAVLRHLRAAGMSADAAFVVAAPLWVRARSTGSPA